MDHLIETRWDLRDLNSLLSMRRNGPMDMKPSERSSSTRRGDARAKIRGALLNGPMSIDEIRQLGIAKATCYRVLGQMERTGEVSHDNGGTRTMYVLKTGTLPATPEMLNEAMNQAKSTNAKVRAEALKDLKILSRESRIDNPTLKYLTSMAETELNLTLLEVLTYQAVHAKKDENTQVIKALQSLIPKVSKTAADTGAEVELREQALLFLQLTTDLNQLTELAIRIIADASDPALTPANPTQFGIIAQNICVDAARHSTYRSKVYDLLLSKNDTVVKRAQKILSLSRERPFIQP